MYNVVCSKLAFRRTQIWETGWVVLNVRLRSYRVRSCQIGLFAYFPKGFFSKKVGRSEA